jgi:hypothetical protein
MSFGNELTAPLRTTGVRSDERTAANMVGDEKRDVTEMKNFDI